ncbi:MAG: PilZ domain-containing protein [Phycisphaerales bacterium]|nr:PilZ domain-containing protein [Phycisphaerales bacterium]
MSTTPDEILFDVQISKEDVKRILDRLDASESNVTTSKRRSLRRPLRGLSSVVCVVDPDNPPINLGIRLRNFSRHGIAFLSGRQIAPGIPLKVKLPIGPNGKLVEKEAVTRRCRWIEGSVHEIGAEFTSWEVEKEVGHHAETSP